MKKRQVEPWFTICPKCRNYPIERSWCDHCKRTGIVGDSVKTTIQDWKPLTRIEDEKEASQEKR